MLRPFARGLTSLCGYITMESWHNEVPIGTGETLMLKTGAGGGECHTVSGSYFMQEHHSFI